MVKIITFSHDCAEKGKKKRCEINMKNDLLFKPKEHKEELQEIREMNWSEFRKKYKECRI